MKQVIPATVKYNFETVSPAIEVLEMYQTVLLLCMTIQTIEVEINVLPPLQPNEYMLTTHRDKATKGEDWEIFAWACRDVMAKVGKFGKHDIDFA